MAKKLFLSFVLALVSALALVGCGGGGGASTGGGSGNNSAAGRTAATQAAKAIFAINASTGATNFDSREIGAQKGLIKYAVMARNPSSRSDSWEYDPYYDLYYRYIEFSSTTGTYQFARDSTGVVEVGQIDVRITDDLPYPISVEMDIVITDGTYLFDGSFEYIMFDDAGESYNLKANYGLNQPTARVVLDVQVRPLAITGDLAVSLNGDTVIFNDIVVTSTLTTLRWTYGGFTGTAGAAQESNDGFVTVETTEGLYRWDWDNDYNTVLTYPSGQEEALGKLDEL